MPFISVTADGNLNEVVSNEISVVPGQTITLIIWIRWTGITYTGTDPISFGVTEYMEDQEGFSVDLASAGASPPAASSSPGTNDFIKFTTTYTVPDDGVDEIRMRFRVAPTLTAGTVDWSEGAMFPDLAVRDASVPGVGTTVDNIANELFGLNQSGWLHSDAADALGAQSNVVKSNSMDIEELQAAATPGASAQDRFERSASSVLGSNWDENYGSGNGTWSLNGHDAFWQTSPPNGPRESVVRWIGATGTVSNTDYQTISVVLSSQATTVDHDYGHNDLIARCDSTEQNYIRFRVGANTGWSLSKFISGVETVMAFGAGPKAAAGSTLYLICGNKATSTPRHFTVRIGSAILASGVLGDTTSQFGAGFRGWGFGGRAEGVLFGVQAVPGAVAQWTGRDTT